MDTRIFIEKLIDGFFSVFPKEQQISYEFDKLANTHFLLVSELVYNNGQFPRFDSEMSTEAYDFGIQGQVCFTTDIYMLDVPEIFYNQFDNNVVLSKLHYFVDPKNIRFDLSVFENSRLGIIAGESFVVLPETLALAA